jgi:hypothetical protein
MGQIGQTLTNLTPLWAGPGHYSQHDAMPLFMYVICMLTDEKYQAKKSIVPSFKITENRKPDTDSTSTLSTIISPKH